MPTRTPRVVERQAHLQPVPESARLARDVVVSALKEVAGDDLADPATLLVSELVTNAILHARTAIEVTVQASATGVHVQVVDGSDQQPSRRDYGTDATTGRGLELVDLLATRHGSNTLADGGKRVWFELGTTVGDERPAPADEPVARETTVRLVGVPLRLARAWQQHVDALLRDYVLLVAGSTAYDGARAAQRDLAGTAFRTLAAAISTAPTDVSHGDLALAVPADDVAAYTALDDLLEHILNAPERDRMLTPPTQPEIRALRRWCTEEVRRQSAGEAPEPWSGLQVEDVERRRNLHRVDWDTGRVRESAEPLIAADDANTIIAASTGVHELLGWPSGDLVGKRVITVIPERFREDHVAAWSDHLLTGRSTILGQTLNLPALHHDGHEVPVHLEVWSELAAGGHLVFLARLQPDTTAARG